MAGEVQQAVQFEVEQLAEADAGAAQDHQTVPGERIRQPGDRGHQVAVVVGDERAGQRLVQARDVARVQQSLGGALRPAPDGEVAEERPQVHHRPLGHRRGDRLVAGDPAAPRATVVVGQERLEMCSGQLRQPPHLGVRGRQVLAEHDQAVRP